MSPLDPSPTDVRPKRTRPSSFVTPRVAMLQNRLLENHDSEARAVLAQLRAAAAGEPGAAWAMSEYLLPEQEFFDQVVRTDSANVDSADFAETAIHIAMTSYASLQQAKAEPMHVEKRSLGTAARLLGEHPGEQMDRGKVWERLSKLAQAPTISSLRWQLRGLLSLLKRRGIGLDAGKLADDVYFWQIPSTRTTVQRNWSRAFFTTTSSTASEPKAPETPTTR